MWAKCRHNNNGDIPGPVSLIVLLAIKIRWKFRLTLFQSLFIRSQPHFAHATTANTCTKFCSDHFARVWTRVRWNFHHIRIVMENVLLKWTTGTQSSFLTTGRFAFWELPNAILRNQTKCHKFLKKKNYIICTLKYQFFHIVQACHFVITKAMTGKICCPKYWWQHRSKPFIVIYKWSVQNNGPPNYTAFRCVRIIDERLFLRKYYLCIITL